MALNAEHAREARQRWICKVQVGDTAGKIWHFLNDNGPQTVAQLKKRLNGTGDLVGLAVGWLSREDKVYVSQEKRALKVALK